MTLPPSSRGRAAALIVVALLGAPIETSRAQNAQRPAPAPSSAAVQSGTSAVAADLGPYCGLFSLYSFSRINGGDLNLFDVLRPENVGYVEGSSIAELQRTADGMGIHGLPLERMTLDFLKRSPYPAILHVKKDAVVSPAPDHFVLLLRTENNHALILDQPNPLQRVSFPDLARIWNGDGMLVSVDPINPTRVTRAIWGGHATSLVGIALLILSLTCIERLAGRSNWLRTMWLRKPKLRLASEMVLLGNMAVGVGLIVNVFSPGALLSEAGATQSAEEAHFIKNIRYINRKAMEVRLERGRSVMIDARFAKDFERGHIRGAVNVPVDIGEDAIVEAVRDLAEPNAPIVIYCQSSSCPFSYIVARALLKNGYSDLSIYKGGWRDWRSRGGGIDATTAVD